MAIVAIGQALPPGGEHADAIAFLCRLANDGGVPKAGPPQVIAGTRPVLTMCKAFLFFLTSHPVRLRLASVPRKRFWAEVATLDFPDPTGVPRSMTGRLALTISPTFARFWLALLAAELSFDRTMVLGGYV